MLMALMVAIKTLELKLEILMKLNRYLRDLTAEFR